MHGLLASLVTTAEMASTLGKRGGSVRSAAKRQTARANDAKGGRPNPSRPATQKEPLRHSR